MGLKPEEYLKLTPAEFFAMVEAYGDEQYKINYRFASIVAAIYEVNRNHKKHKKPFKPEDFVGKKDEKQSTDEMIEAARAATLKLGGIKK